MALIKQLSKFKTRFHNNQLFVILLIFEKSCNLKTIMTALWLKRPYHYSSSRYNMVQDKKNTYKHNIFCHFCLVQVEQKSETLYSIVTIHFMFSKGQKRLCRQINKNRSQKNVTCDMIQVYNTICKYILGSNENISMLKG